MRVGEGSSECAVTWLEAPDAIKHSGGRVDYDASPDNGF